MVMQEKISQSHIPTATIISLNRLQTAMKILFLAPEKNSMTHLIIEYKMENTMKEREIKITNNSRLKCKL